MSVILTDMKIDWAHSQVEYKEAELLCIYLTLSKLYITLEKNTHMLTLSTFDHQDVKQNNPKDHSFVNKQLLEKMH